ncbi:IS1595 family transposase [Parvularcula marina]|uniref:IS1595 family transposase n=1 Tax=Parvularcula marina TaxID=2292771 RepID=A0A371RGH6_9PROT|nr:IS1595 family transposase [Parvularcula marina]RFB04539.1 IS1595 family transposase [Parvularcula marina]
MSILSKPFFHNEKAAYEWVEARVWPEGPACPRCGEKKRIGELKGNSTRIGVRKCYTCRKPFTVKVGTLMESSHIPMTKWLQAIYLMCSSKKGISSHQLSRTLGVTVKSAWFLSHRIREAMRTGDLAPFGGGGGIVEVDETYVGGKTSNARGKYKKKAVVLTLVDRDTGRARSFHIERATKAEILPILRDNLDAEARVITDEYSVYKNLDTEYAHAYVVHSKKQWGRGEIHTNTIEGFYSIMKRGLRGVYQHCSKKHLHRYAGEFDFRYSNRAKLGIDDMERTEAAVAGLVGKRLTYHQADENRVASRH